MAELLPDFELDHLIDEINQEAMGSRQTPGAADERGPRTALDPPRLGVVTDGEPLEELLATMVTRKASDLLLVPESPPVLRINGSLVFLGSDPLTDEQVRSMLAPHLGQRHRERLSEQGSADFSLRLASTAGLDGAAGSAWRLRVNLQRQRGVLAVALRALPRRVPSLSELNLPQSLEGLIAQGSGLVLVCGPTGSGKTTTLAALIGLMNGSQAHHIITIEDPIEYEHDSCSSVIEQVEVGSDAPTFAAALRASLRRDPDVILVGEMRDLETISIALTAAETGHLILSTLHTGDAAQAIHRIIDVFPEHQQAQVRQQLSLSLRAVVCQQLLPLLGRPGRVPALEVLVGTYAVRNHIRKGALHHLYNELGAGKREHMCLMEESLAELVQKGLVGRDQARSRTTRPDELERMLG
jgi:twitching motility protein PilT